MLGIITGCISSHSSMKLLYYTSLLVHVTTIHVYEETKHKRNCN